MIELQENKDRQTKACVVFPFTSVDVGASYRLFEAIGLAQAINLDVVHSEVIKLREIRPATYVGKGFLETLRPMIEEGKIELLIVDAGLSPIQQRNLEKELKIKVIDRTALILEIFGERAHTREGKLQVELAHLTYQRSRLVRSWTHLERQRGGAGFLGGPGETQIELDRRIIDDKIVKLKKELEKVKKTRDLQRGARKKVPYPVVALVGYTNAGKSSLFNLFTKANVFAKDLLFATLDPTLRKIKLPSGVEVILSDTVGFISDLPHELVMSFRATLEEVLEADVVVHVRDIANENSAMQKKDVLGVLHSLGLKEIENQDNYIEVLNKIDLLENSKAAVGAAKRAKNTVATSAVSGEGCDKLLEMVASILGQGMVVKEISLSAEDGKAIAWLHQHAEVLESKLKGKKMVFKVRINEADWERLGKR